MKRNDEKYAQINLPVTVALLVGILFLLSWWTSAGSPWPALVAPLCIVGFLLSFIGPQMVVLWWNRVPSPRCELCERKRGSSTDQMVWARRFGLQTCEPCSYKLRSAFGDVFPESHPDAMLH